MLADYRVSENGMVAYLCEIRVVASETDQYLLIENHLVVLVLAPAHHLWIANCYESLVLEGVPRPVIVNYCDLLSLVDHRVNVRDFDADEDVFPFVSVAPPVPHPFVLVRPNPCPFPDHQQVCLQADVQSLQVEHAED